METKLAEKISRLQNSLYQSCKLKDRERKNKFSVIFLILFSAPRGDKKENQKNYWTPCIKNLDIVGFMMSSVRCSREDNQAGTTFSN